MKHGCFVFDGVTYPTGTEILIRQPTDGAFSLHQKAYFVYYDDEYDMYAYQLNGKQMFLHNKSFWYGFGGVTGTVNENIRMPEVAQLKDTQILKLFVGWAWYILVMGLAFILQDAIAVWILASVIFFCWRHNVIKEEGYYVKW